MPPFASLITDRVAAVTPRRQPFMVRRNYAYELKSAATFPLAAALGEGTFTGVVASKYFQAGPFLVAVITAAPMFGNILALLWSELAESRPKVRFINQLQIALVIVTAAVGLTYFIPRGEWTITSWFGIDVAAWTFVGLIIAARVLASGIITLRSAVWRLNYPRNLRAQIIGRINGVYNIVLASMVLAAAFALDAQPAVYAILYPVVAVVSLLGVLQFSKIRVRGERQLLRRARLIPSGLAGDDCLESGGVRPDYSRTMKIKLAGSPVGRLAKRIRDAFGLLGEDRMFREYQWWQFILGSSFMLMFPSLIYVVSTEMTDPVTQYVLAILVMQFLPMITSVVFLQIWAPFFDRVDLFTFRIWINVAAMIAHSLILTGALLNSLPIVALGMFAVGVSFGGGQLAWQLGQNAFATPETVNRYMGLHVMLTGIRGMFAPFVGAGLYHLLSKFLPSAGFAGDAPGGRWVFLASVLLATSAFFGYISMKRRYGDELQRRDSEPVR